MRRPAALAAALVLVACSHATATPPVAPVGLAAPKKPAGGAQQPTTEATSAKTSAPLDLLASRLDAVLANTDSCLLVTDGRTGAVRYRRAVDIPLAAASAQKLLVAAAALDRLGPGYRFTTTVVAARAPVGGAVDDLWLVGSGDPLLSSPGYVAYLQSLPAAAGYPTTPAAALADQLFAAGVRRVANAIHGDDSRFERSRYLATWPPTLNQGEFDIGPLSALEVDQGLDRWRPDVVAADPTRHAADVLAFLLAAKGTAVGSGASGRAPAGAVVLARVSSAPLADMVAAMLRASDNQIAELLVREIDRRAAGSTTAGTTAGGLAIVTATAARLGLPTTGVALVDASGLSRTNRVTCRALLGALDLGDQPRFSVLSTGLGVAGVSGTMYNLFRGTPLAGHLAAKGGYIIGVSALVGRLDVGHPVRFAFVVDGTKSFAAGLDLVTHVLDQLARP